MHEIKLNKTHQREKYLKFSVKILNGDNIAQRAIVDSTFNIFFSFSCTFLAKYNNVSRSKLKVNN